MIKLIDDNIINFEGIIIVPNSKGIYYKNKYINYDYDITTLKKYILSLYSGDKKLANSFVEYIYMYKAFVLVKNALKRYKDFFSFSFINELINTYNNFFDYELNDDDKIMDLKLIFQKYEELLSENNFINYKVLINDVINNYNKKENIFLLDLEKLDNDEIRFIKKVSTYNDVFIKPILLENNNLNEALGKIDSSINLNILSFDNSKRYNFVGTNDIEEELSYVLNDIFKKVLEGYKYRDFLIVSNDINSYYPYFDFIFDIPYSQKEKSGLLTSRFLSYFSRLLNGDFSCSNFINLLKLDVFQISLDLVDKLDNYVYSWNLEDKSFYEEFTFNPNGNKETFSLKDKDLLNELNSAKESIITPIKYLLENIVGEKNVKTILKEFYTYLSVEKIDEKLFFTDPKGLNSLIDLLEVINDNLDIDIDVSALFELINTIDIKEEKVLYMQDEISVSDLENALYDDKKFIYLIGASENVMPRSFALKGLLNIDNLTKEDLIEKITEYENNENYYLYKLLSNSNVTILYHKLSSDLKLMNKAKFINNLNIYEEKYNEIYNKKLLINKYASLIAEDKTDLINKDIFNKVNDSKKHDLNYKVSYDAVNAISSSNLKLSPSSIENYAKCPFYYYCGNLLRLKVKEKYLFDNREVGTFVHYVLENIIKNDYDKVNLDNVGEFINKYSVNYLKEHNKIINNTSLYVIKKLSENVCHILKNIINENDISAFKPTYFEFKISEENTIKPINVKLNNGNLSIIGTIDRVDTYEAENIYYYRIIDYKTGTKKFRLDDMLEGLNLQMLIYLIAIKESKDSLTNKKINASGVFYYPSLLKEKSEASNLNEYQKNDTIKERLKMDGVLNYSDNSLDIYGNESFGDYAKVTTRGNFNEERLYNNDDLDNIFNKIKEILVKIGNEILNGNFSVNPILSSRVDSCTYCKYKSICKFDYQIDKKRKLKDYSNKEVLKMLEGDKNA